jgi:hypothetical protein
VYKRKCITTQCGAAAVHHHSMQSYGIAELAVLTGLCQSTGRELLYSRVCCTQNTALQAALQVCFLCTNSTQSHKGC